MKVVDVQSELDIIAASITDEFHFTWKTLIFDGPKECIDAALLDSIRSATRPLWFKCLTFHESLDCSEFTRWFESFGAAVAVPDDYHPACASGISTCPPVTALEWHC